MKHNKTYFIVDSNLKEISDIFRTKDINKDLIFIEKKDISDLWGKYNEELCKLDTSIVIIINIKCCKNEITNKIKDHFSTMDIIPVFLFISVEKKIKRDSDYLIFYFNGNIIPESINQQIENFSRMILLLHSNKNEVLFLNEKNRLLEDRLYDYMNNYSKSIVDKVQQDEKNSILEKRLNEYIHDFSNSMVNTIELSQKNKINEKRLSDFISSFSTTLVDFIVTEKESKDLEILSTFDPLTKVNNRRAFMKSLEKESNRASRENNIFSCIILDIDNFKTVNDTYGHLIGDMVLIKIGRILSTISIFRESDTTARFGGEEFVILLPDTDSISAAIPAERLREEISKINFTTDNNTSFNITISLGISEYRKSDSKNEDIIDRADKALYRAKHMNKNQVVIYEKMDDLDTYDN